MLLTLLISLLPFVNPFVGTDAHGHTFPGAVYPFGMIQLSPDTRPNAGDWDGCSGYHYSDSLIYGFSHTHLSGTGCDDWCDILITPGDGPSTFKHSNEKASPGYYEVKLDNGILARLTVGRRAAMHEYTFPKGSVPRITLDLNHRDYVSACKIEFDRGICTGFRKSDSWARGQEVHFYIDFPGPPVSSVEFTEGGRKAVFTFPEGTRRVKLQVALSSVSSLNACYNLWEEHPAGFETMRKNTAKAWEAYLKKVPCPYKDKEHKTRFYTALYHTAIHPTLYSDVNGEYRGMDGKVHKADGWDRYTVFSLWDTFRGLHPLLVEIEPKRSVDFIKSMLSIYDEAGKLPVWELSGWETNCMIGYNAAPVIADAIMRGLQGFDYEHAFQAMLASARNGEFGLDSFRENGLVLADDEHESVSKTLEYAFDDWCVAQVALKLGHMDEYKAFMTSSQYWKNVLDPETKFMRARLNGRWFTPFDPREVNNNYTEANSWQYSFFVPHDIPGLIEALGGPEAFEARLDALFEAPEQTTGRTQADITGLIGQYAHGNEPSHHIAYLYDYIGKPEKRQARVNQILETLYSSAPDGLCGNEDCGQMSAWYVLSSLGKYPVCPVSVISAHSSVIPSEVEESIVTNPAFVMSNDIFTDSLTVAIQGEGTIYYTVASYGGQAQKYVGPFTVYEPCQMQAWAERDGKQSFITWCSVRQVQKDRAIKILSRYNRQYNAGGDEGLIDSTRGGTNWRTGGWQGYQDTDFVAILNLLQERHLSVIGAGFCQDARSWIWMPRYVEFSISDDGENFTTVGRLNTTVDPQDYVVQTWDAEIPVDCKARYVKYFAKNIGTIPEWHPGAGYPGFIFTDEVWAR